MIAEIGLLCLAAAFFGALATCALSFRAAYLDHIWLMRSAQKLFLFTAFCVTLAFVALVLCFLRDDFSVALVAEHSQRAQPTLYKIAASWGNHEGSLLLWVWVLVFWGSLLCRARSITPPYRNLCLGILALLLFAFLGFSIFTSNPFDRLLPLPAAQGKGLNPLLQDPAMMAHPPLLYLGYVGFALPFALAMAHLLVRRDQQDRRWALWARRWTLAPWACLTAGITLGSWWAYYELGWGGFWFWDPVENASLMPWLLGTALIHSLHLASNYSVFYLWSVLLAIGCFALSILGTFLVRSGVLVSVHAFATDPARGVYLLTLLLLSTGLALTVMRMRGQTALFSEQLPARVYMLVVNNYLLSVCTAVVLCGTLFPLLAQSLGRGVWSVGPPYFNTVLVPLFLLSMWLMASAPKAWRGRAESWQSWLGRQSWWAYSVEIAVFAGIGVLLQRGLEHLHQSSAALWIWIALAMIARLAWHSIVSIRYKHLGAGVAHLGLAICALGISASSGFGVARDFRMAVGEQARLGAWSFSVTEEKQRMHANYSEQVVVVEATRAQPVPSTAFRRTYQLEASKRRYRGHNPLMSEAGISGNVLQDLYLTVGEKDARGAWTMRIQIKPMARLIWIGGFLMALGGILGLANPARTTPARRARDIGEAGA